MFNAIYAGVAGVKNEQAQMDIIGNNLANLNTTGFKQNRITFADTLNATLMGGSAARGNFGGFNPMQLGTGASISSVNTDFTQGSLDATGLFTDMAISGRGFFVVGDATNQYYTRAGGFELQNDGTLLAQGGLYYVKGKMADANGNLPSTSALENIVLPFGKKEPAQATANANLFCNLNKNSSETEEWILNSAFTTADDTPADINTYLNTISEMESMKDGDQITIGGTDRTGAPITATFTYGQSNDGVTVGALLNKINTAFNSSSPEGATATIDSSGKLRLTANSTGENQMTLILTGLSPANPNTFLTDNVLTTTATDNPLAGLQSTLGELTGVSYGNGDQIIITPHGTGQPVTLVFDTAISDADAHDPNTTNIGAATTIEDLLNKINSHTAEGFGASGLEAQYDETNGQIYFTQPDGAAAYSVSITNTVANNATSGGLAMNFNPIEASPITLPSFKNLTEGVTGEHSTSVEIYDSLGDTHLLNIKYTQDAQTANKWNYKITVDDGAITPTSGSTGTLEFNEDGSLKLFSGTGNPLQFAVAGANPMSITLNPGTVGSFNGITQMASPSTSLVQDQDGHPMGTLSKVTVDNQGVLTGVYSNGVSKVLAQVAIANFTNEGGLSKEGNSMFSSTVASGDAQVGWAGTSNSTMIRSTYLENSNVDLTDQFSRMILSQRALNASAKVITTADTIINTIIQQIKRT